MCHEIHELYKATPHVMETTLYVTQVICNTADKVSAFPFICV